VAVSEIGQVSAEENPNAPQAAVRCRACVPCTTIGACVHVVSSVLVRAGNCRRPAHAKRHVRKRAYNGNGNSMRVVSVTGRGRCRVWVTGLEEMEANQLVPACILVSWKVLWYCRKVHARRQAGRRGGGVWWVRRAVDSCRRVCLRLR